MRIHSIPACCSSGKHRHKAGPGISVPECTQKNSAYSIQIIPSEIFFHPDYTVGLGVSPGHALRLVGYTTGRDFHPALKIFY